MPRYAPNKMPLAVKRRYFELIRTGLSGSAAAQQVGVSLSCGSLWFMGTDLNAWTADQLNYVAAELNDRPRLCLADQTPNEAMQRWARQQTRR